MSRDNYKYATIVLAIAVIILGWMLLQKQPAAEGVSDATQTIKDCRTQIAGWTATNKSVAQASPAARAELDAIISNCQEKVGQAQ